MSLVIREMQIKSQCDTISHLLKWLSSINQQITSAGKIVEKREPSCTVGGNADWYSHWKTVWKVLKKLKMDLPFDPATPLLGTYPKKPKTVIWKNIRTPMFIWYPKYIKNLQNSTPKNQTTQFKKWAKDLNRRFSKEDMQIANKYEKMLSITNHQRNVN